MKAMQQSFLPDNDIEVVKVKRPSVPLVKWIDGRYLWKQIDGEDWVSAPDLEAILLAAQSKQRKAT